MDQQKNNNVYRELDDRSRAIFRQVVDSYLETGEPLGSRNLSRLLPMTLSPASVRNVMADLEHAGLIFAPHTSAGRLPTERGLRFFVDAMLEIGDLTQSERQNIEAQVAASDSTRSMETLLTEASQMLSGLTRGAGVVSIPKADSRLRHLEFVRLEKDKALAVLVAENGSVENRIIEIPPDLPPSALIEATNYLNDRILGQTLSQARAELERQQSEQRAELDQLTRAVVDAGLASWANSADGAPDTLIVRGRSNLLDDLTAAEDLERIRQLFDELEAKRDLAQLLSLAEDGDGVRIFIGSENKLFSLSGSSLIVSPFRDGQQKILGVLGIIGPTRLNYARVIPMVDYTAKVVGRLLS
jgi:heat-inducible transcriptional repressor